MRAPWLLLNATPSEPPGLYLRTDRPIRPGAIIAFPPPPLAASTQGGRLAKFPTFLKAVAAGAGDLVCTRNRRLVINRRYQAPIATTDFRAQPLPHWIDCRRLTEGEVFVFSGRVPNSFDSRYFGPVPAKSVLSTYRLLWAAPQTGATP